MKTVAEIRRDNLISIETLMAIIFEEELQKIALIEGQKENFTK